MVFMLKKFKEILGGTAEKEAVRKLYIASVAQARNPFFYLEAGVPDTLDGRFDLIVLHLFALHRKLSPESGRLLIETFIDDMDRNLREMGVGDVGVGKRVRKMSEALYGRIAAYDEAMVGKRSWHEALIKNVYGAVQPAQEQATQLESYAKKLTAYISAQPNDLLAGGNLSYGGLL